MDGRKFPISPSAHCGRIDADAAPTESVRESSSVIYCGSAQQVSEGFAMALRAMGLEAGIRPPGIAQPGNSSNPDDEALKLAEGFALHRTRRPAP